MLLAVRLNICPPNPINDKTKKDSASFDNAGRHMPLSIEHKPHFKQK